MGRIWKEDGSGVRQPKCKMCHRLAGIFSRLENKAANNAGRETGGDWLNERSEKQTEFRDLFEEMEMMSMVGLEGSRARR